MGELQAVPFTDGHRDTYADRQTDSQGVDWWLLLLQVMFLETHSDTLSVKTTLD